jgi:hypothetical protein
LGFPTQAARTAGPGPMFVIVRFNKRRLWLSGTLGCQIFHTPNDTCSVGFTKMNFCHTFQMRAPKATKIDAILTMSAYSAVVIDSIYTNITEYQDQYKLASRCINVNEHEIYQHRNE